MKMIDPSFKKFKYMHSDWEDVTSRGRFILASDAVSASPGSYASSDGLNPSDTAGDGHVL